MDMWEVLFDDIKQCACINCKEKRAKTRALRNTIPQVKLIRYSSAIRDSQGTAGQIKSKPRAVPFKPSFDDNLLRRMLWSTVSKVALRSSNININVVLLFFFLQNIFHYFKSAVSVLWFLLQADCATGYKLLRTRWPWIWLKAALSMSLDTKDKLLREQISS